MRRWQFCLFVSQLLVTAAVVAVAWFSPWSGVDPSLWGDLSVGLGLRPADQVAAGWWRGLVRILSAHQPLAELEQTLRLAGVAGLGLVTYLAFGLLERLLPYGACADMRERALGRMVVNLVLLLGTLSFVASDAVWRAGQGAGPLLADIILILLIVRLVFDFMVQRGTFRIYVAAVLLGWLSGDQLLGFVGFLALLAIVMYKSFSNLDNKENPLANPEVRYGVVMLTSILFLSVAAGMLAVNYWLYGAFGGLRNSDVLAVNFAYVVLGDMFRTARSLMSPFGWLFAVVFTAVPAGFAYVAMPRVIRDDRLPSRRYALALVISGIVAWSQVSPFPACWWPSWFSIARVNDDLSRVVMTLVGTVTLVWAFDIFCLMAAFVDFRQIVGYQFEDSSSDTAAERAIGMMTRFRFGQLAVAFVLLLGALVFAWPSGRRLALGRLRAVIDDYCREVVRECADGATVLLTDGWLDEGVELAARAAGQELVAVSMVSGGGEREVSLRQRAATDDRERTLLEAGGSDALRYWSHEATNRLSSVAQQFGFVQRNASSVPSVVMSGLLGRLAGADRAAAEAGVVRARALGERILEICKTENLDRLQGGRLTELFRFVQWRVSQMCRVRMNYADAKTWGEGERQDEALNARLDDLNPALADLKKRLEVSQQYERMMLTPEEGLKIALIRADFRLARSFAETVLLANPQNAHAHFALGMFHLVNGEYRSAVPHLERVLETKGEEAAVLNNLATAYDRLGERKKALGYAERAMLAAPDNQVIRQNLERLRGTANGF